MEPDLSPQDKIDILSEALEELIEYVVMSNEAQYGTLSASLVEGIALEALERIKDKYD